MTASAYAIELAVLAATAASEKLAIDIVALWALCVYGSRDNLAA